MIDEQIQSQQQQQTTNGPLLINENIALVEWSLSAGVEEASGSVISQIHSASL